MKRIVVTFISSSSKNVLSFYTQMDGYKMLSMLTYKKVLALKKVNGMKEKKTP